MKIDFKKPKYVLPLISLPFLFLLNYGLLSFSKDDVQTNDEGTAELQEGIGNVSEQIRNKGIDGKLDAFRSRYKSADGYTAINNLKLDVEDQEFVQSEYNEAEKRMLDSIDNALKNAIHQPSQKISPSLPPKQYNSIQPAPTMSAEDEELLKAIEQFQGGGQGRGHDQTQYDDPMELFRAQMVVIDSISKANDPEYQSMEKEENPESEITEQPKIKVSKAITSHEIFNTVRIGEDNSFIKAIVDEYIEKGTMGGRLRIRLLDDIMVGGSLLKKGSYLYALISGYEPQRVKLSITSVMIDDKIFPINLSIYDNDGMEGLYVPASAFREFTKDLGGNATGGMNLQMQQDPSSMNQFYMSTLQKLFTSTSQAMSKTIKQNKANLKYGTFIYLIDQDELGENLLTDLEIFN
jgi:conjugative transposon TraM protein